MATGVSSFFTSEMRDRQARGRDPYDSGSDDGDWVIEQIDPKTANGSNGSGTGYSNAMGGNLPPRIHSLKSDEPYAVYKRRRLAAQILDSPELLLMAALRDNESVPYTRLKYEDDLENDDIEGAGEYGEEGSEAQERQRIRRLRQQARRRQQRIRQRQQGEREVEEAKEGEEEDELETEGGIFGIGGGAGGVRVDGDGNEVPSDEASGRGGGNAAGNGGVAVRARHGVGVGASGVTGVTFSPFDTVNNFNF
ncbi:hypothetical protein GGR50DRAFT_602336 [Xylaria sp. CBS 124048]|nr:hypothetical protein GGR50DRAFT_602336 [Xylaria sp. CBS 124048]